MGNAIKNERLGQLVNDLTFFQDLAKSNEQ